MTKLIGPWKNVPLDDDSEQSIIDTEWKLQFYGALREKWKALGDRYWLRQSRVWFSAPALSLTLTEVAIDMPLIDDDSDPDTDMVPMEFVQDGVDPWSGQVVDVEDNPLGYNADQWGVFIECNGDMDPQRVIYSDIESWTNDGVLTIKNIKDYITSGEIVLDDVQGTLEVFIVRRPLAGNPTLRWSDRIPPWPNAREIAKGWLTSCGAGVGALAAFGYVTDTKQIFLQNQFAVNDQQIMVWGDDGYMHRCAIVENPPDVAINPADPFYWHTITFDLNDGEDPWVPVAGPDAVLGINRLTNYAVIKEDAIYRLGRERHQTFAWYRGAFDRTLTHHPVSDGSSFLVHAPLPATGVSWLTMNPVTFECEEQTFPAFDIDRWVSDEEECAPPYNADTAKSPHIAKSWRYVQQEIDRLATQFIPAKEYESLFNMPKFTLATFYAAADIGLNRSIGISTIDTGANVFVLSGDLNLPFYPIKVHFTVNYIPHPSTIQDYPYSGTAIAVSGSRLEGVLFSTGTYDLPNQEGAQLFVGTGWVAFFQLRFRHGFPIAGFFIPDVGSDEFGGSIIYDPAQVVDWEESAEFGVGRWAQREVDTHYVDEEGGNEFKPGDLAIYAGNTWNDAVEGGVGDEDPLLVYFDKNFEGRVPDAMMNRSVLGSLHGFATGGSIKRLETEMHWYEDVWYPSVDALHVGHVEEGIASGGSTTHLLDNDKHDDDETGAFFKASRFVAFDGIYNTFPIEIEVNDDVWETRIITSCDIDGSRVQIGWDEPTSSTANGKRWRIPEPQYHIHRWRNHVVQVKRKANGAIMERVCKYSSNGIIWPEVDWPSAIEEGDEWWIIKPLPGTVWQFKTAPPEDHRPYFKVDTNKYWVAPRGPDEVRTGVTDPLDFHNSQHENLPTIVRRFRHFGRWDNVHYQEFYNQLWRGLNTLRWTRHTAQFFDQTPVDTSGAPTITGGNKATGTGSKQTWAAAKAMAENGTGSFPGYGGSYDKHHELETFGTPPYAFSTGTGIYTWNGSVWTPTNFTAQLTRHADKARATTPSLLDRQLDFYSIASKPPPAPLPASPQAVFDDNGDPVAEEALALWHENVAVPAGTAIGESNYLGDLAVPPPNWTADPPIPSAPPTGGPVANVRSPATGYQVTQVFVIARWDVPGGMTYLDEVPEGSSPPPFDPFPMFFYD